MNSGEVIRNCPDLSATNYIIYQNKVFYLKYCDGRWYAWFSYDCSFGWGLVNQDVINKNIKNIKPLN